MSPWKADPKIAAYDRHLVSFFPSAPFYIRDSKIITAAGTWQAMQITRAVLAKPNVFGTLVLQRIRREDQRSLPGGDD